MIIYTTGPQCTRCQALKAACQEVNIAYEERSLSEMLAAEIASYICDIGGYPMSAPVVKNEGRWFTPEDTFEDIMAGKRETKVFSGVGGQPDQIERSSSKIWGKT
ncbi:hypothetical protein M0R72_15850 [Candidatus Pacearchaeota archaeon]|jgi:glutaredoxin|nr:hypothetical protein [Candidatus Pacearchaeota archaeon]